jgi:hypothetical protein
VGVGEFGLDFVSWLLLQLLSSGGCCWVDCFTTEVENVGVEWRGTHQIPARGLLDRRDLVGGAEDDEDFRRHD